jgi:hypothetical protein
VNILSEQNGMKKRQADSLSMNFFLLMDKQWIILSCKVFFSWFRVIGNNLWKSFGTEFESSGALNSTTCFAVFLSDYWSLSGFYSWISSSFSLQASRILGFVSSNFINSYSTSFSSSRGDSLVDGRMCNQHHLESGIL